MQFAYKPNQTNQQVKAVPAQSQVLYFTIGEQTPLISPHVMNEFLVWNIAETIALCYMGADVGLHQFTEPYSKPFSSQY